MAKKTTNRRTKRDNNKLIKCSFNHTLKNLPIEIKFGKFTAARVCLEETAINNKVLRVCVESLVNGIVKNRSKQKSLDKRRLTKKTSQSTSLKNFRIDCRLILRKRTRSPYRAVNIRKNVPLKKRQNFNRKSINKLSKKRPIMSSIEAMIPEFKISKSIKKTTSKSTQTHQTNYKYLLKSTSNSCCRVPSRLCLDFIELPNILRSIKLPDPTWKIKIFMRDVMRMSISVTNNKRPERCVTFTSKNEFYQIIIDDKPVRLLACPETLSERKDFEALIHIVSCISVDDCMVSPVTDGNF